MPTGPRQRSGAMSLKLQAPLNAIGGYIELLAMGLRGPVTEDQRADFYGRANFSTWPSSIPTRSSTAQESGLAGNGYAVSDIINGCDSLKHAIQLDRATHRAVGARSTESRATPASSLARIRKKVAQILVNLLSNAIKFYTRAGTSAPSARQWMTPCDTDHCNNGRGIPEDKLDSIFGPFVQLKEGLADREGGVGLGLSISRDLARAMKGDLNRREHRR